MVRDAVWSIIMRVYLAGPLFTVAERRFNEELALAISHECDGAIVVLPQHYAAEIGGTKDFLERMYAFCLEQIDEAELIVAVLDGPDADSGTCIEMGYAKAKHKKIIGIRTDLRASEDRGVNLMVAACCTSMIHVPTVDTTIEIIAVRIREAAC